TLVIRYSSDAEKCGRPEAIYKQDLKLFTGVEDLSVWAYTMTKKDAQHYLATNDEGTHNQNPLSKSDGRYGPCVTYGGTEKTWPLMWKVIKARGTSAVADLAESKNEIVDLFPNLKTLRMTQFHDGQAIEPAIKKLKKLTVLEACPTSGDNVETVFSEITGVTELKLSGCFLASAKKQAPKLGASEALKTVVFEENGWTALPADFFAQTPNLESISLIKNEVQTLPPGLFKDLKNLKRVDLRWMKLDKAEKERVRKELLSASPALSAKKAIRL
ncbi:MAG: leucine-rich repeat domain-containing protein, partial [Bdellovibrionota bacterium]